jgi:hypothetical protein
LADVQEYVCPVTVLGSTLVKTYEKGMLSTSGYWEYIQDGDER